MRPRRTTAEEMAELRRKQPATAVRLSDAEEIVGYLSVHPLVAVALNDMTDVQFFDLMERARRIMKGREVYGPVY